jgi:hypothetical protein
MDTRYFQRSLFPQLPSLTEADVIGALTPHYPLFWHTIMEPWKRFLKYRAKNRDFSGWSIAETADWLTFQATRKARQLLYGKEGFRLITRHGKLLIIFEERLAITIKKLTRRSWRRGQPEELTRSNFLTESNKAYWDQRRRTDFPDFPRVILGYELLKEITQVRVLIAYPRSQARGVEWACPIPRQTPLTQETYTPRIITGGEEQPEKGFVITPPDQSERRGEDKDTGSEWTK